MFCFCFLFLAFYLIRFFPSVVTTATAVHLSLPLSPLILNVNRKMKTKIVETRARAPILYAFEAIQIRFKILILNFKSIQIKPILTGSLVSTYRDSVTFSIVTDPPWIDKIISCLPDGTYHEYTSNQSGQFPKAITKWRAQVCAAAIRPQSIRMEYHRPCHNTVDQKISTQLESIHLMGVSLSLCRTLSVM